MKSIHFIWLIPILCKIIFFSSCAPKMANLKGTPEETGLVVIDCDIGAINRDLFNRPFIEALFDMIFSYTEPVYLTDGNMVALDDSNAIIYGNTYMKDCWDCSNYLIFSGLLPGTYRLHQINASYLY